MKNSTPRFYNDIEMSHITGGFSLNETISGIQNARLTFLLESSSQNRNIIDMIKRFFRYIMNKVASFFKFLKDRISLLQRRKRDMKKSSPTKIVPKDEAESKVKVSMPKNYLSPAIDISNIFNEINDIPNIIESISANDKPSSWEKNLEFSSERELADEIIQSTLNGFKNHNFDENKIIEYIYGPMAEVEVPLSYRDRFDKYEDVLLSLMRRFGDLGDAIKVSMRKAENTLLLKVRSNSSEEELERIKEAINNCSKISGASLKAFHTLFMVVSKSYSITSNVLAAMSK